MRGFTDKYEAFLNESRDSIIGRKEKETYCENKETQAVCNSLHGLWRTPKHGSHHHPHYCEHHESGEKKFWGAPDVFEVSTHEYPCFDQVVVSEFWAKMLISHVVLRDRGYIVILIDSVVAAMWRRSALKHLKGVGVVAR